MVDLVEAAENLRKLLEKETVMQHVAQKDPKHQEHIYCTPAKSFTKFAAENNMVQVEGASPFLHVPTVANESVGTLGDFGFNYPLSEIDIKWRCALEKNPEFLQFISYCPIEDAQGRIALYQRVKYNSHEEALAGMLSVGWGGHVELLSTLSMDVGDNFPQAVSLGRTLVESTIGELRDEVRVVNQDGHGVHGYFDRAENLPLAAMLYQHFPEDLKVVGNYHMGMVCRVVLSDGLSLSTDHIEKPESKFLRWVEPAEFAELAQSEEVEDWSKILLQSWPALKEHFGW